MSKILGIHVLSGLLMMFSAGSSAGDLNPSAFKLDPSWIDPGWRHTVSRVSVMFEKDGLSRTIKEFEYKALDDRGAAMIAQQVFPYDNYFEDLTVSNLETIKADGRVIAVDNRAIRDQPASTATTSPYFDEQRIVMAAFANVEPGDRIRGRVTSVAKRAVIPGAFTGVWTQPVDVPPETMELTVDGPSSMQIQVASRGVSDEQEIRGDRQIHHVTFRQDAPKPLRDAADRFDTARRFEASTFKDYRELAAAIAVRNAPMAEPDDALKQLSNQIVENATTVRDKVQRLNNWVARNIRYVGIGFKDGGLVSEPASAVLASRYGDCKAHATILKALLSVQDIEADLVVVNADPTYTLTNLPTLNFDHAIVYVPALDLYADPTASWVGFGALPSILYGKPVLNIDRGILARIPVLRAEEYSLRTETLYRFRRDGTREGRSTLSGSGVGASLERRYATSLETVDRGEVARHALENADLAGTGTYAFPDPRELSDHFVIQAPFEITRATDLSTPSELQMLAPTDLRPSLWGLVGGDVSDNAFHCSSIKVRDAASLELPDGVSVYEAPSDIAIAESFAGQTALGAVTGRLTAVGSVRVQARTVQSTIEVTIELDAPVCPAEFADRIKAGLAKVDGFTHAAIGITPKPVPVRFDSNPDAVAARAAFKSGDTATSFKLWTQLAEHGSADAQNSLGWMYQAGAGVKQDFAESFRWYMRSAEQSNAFGQSYVAYFYSCGCGVARDDAQAALWYSRSAAQGFTYAEARLAEMTLHGRGTTQDVAQAVTWYEKAARDGDVASARMLGRIFRGNFGIGSDYAKATQWFRLAAENNDFASQLELGTLYAEGHGVPQDDTLASMWLKKGADRGEAEAQYQLGWLYELGRGVEQDRAVAVDWYAKADRQGHAGAHARLEALDGAQ